MKITRQSITNLIKHVDDKIEILLEQIKKQDEVISELQSQNKTLKQNNQQTLDQIKTYIQELEQIRSHYVDSNNNNK
jgi:predicted RNase H-like nuclease (RuvC/YqgF family)